MFQPADGDPSLTIWDAATGQRVAGPKLGAEEGRIGPVAISPDANRMAVITGSTDAQLALQVWQRSGDGWDDIRPQGTPAPYFDGAVAFDATSNRLAYSTADAATLVVDLASGRAETLPPLPNVQAATDAVFLPDGRLRTLSRDGFVVTWAPTPPGGWVPGGPTQHVDGGPNGLLSVNGTRALQDLGGEVVVADVATEVTLVGAAAASVGTTAVVAAWSPREARAVTSSEPVRFRRPSRRRRRRRGGVERPRYRETARSR